MGHDSDRQDSHGGDGARAHLRWRHTENPLIVEAAEVVEGWRHLTVAYPAARGEHSPALERLFAEFSRFRGRPHALCGGRDGDRRIVVIAIGPPDAELEVERLYLLARTINPGDWEISFLGRPVSCPLPP